MDKFYTKSLSLAAAIYSLSPINLKSIHHEGAKAIFIFDKSNEIDRAVNLFWQKKLSIDALSYFESLRYLKSRIYENH